MEEKTTTSAKLPAPLGRKYRMTLIGVGVVMAIGVLAAVLKKFAGIDVTDLAKWAMVTVAASIGLGAGAIAYEDARRPQDDTADR